MLRKLLYRIVAGLSTPIVLSDYFRASTGREYGVGFLAKLKLARQMRRNTRKVTTASHFLEHLLMATEILKIPPEVQGCVVECGCFKGGSSTNLSLICALCNRQLEIFDSFAGLPEPSGSDRQHVLVTSHEIHTYERGAWCGTLPEVKQNISRYGNLSVCNFNPGYFDQTLPGFKKPCVMVFLDVDLIDSLETCLKYLWPLLQDGCYLFTHEAHHQEVGALFFGEEWWRSNLQTGAPGLIGAGTGIGLQPSSGGFRSAIGYTVKNPKLAEYEVSPQTGCVGD